MPYTTITYSACLISAYFFIKTVFFPALHRVVGIVIVFLFVHCPLPDRVFYKILFILMIVNYEASQRIKMIIKFFSEV